MLLGGASYGVVSPLIKVAYARGISTETVTDSQYLYGLVILWFIRGLGRVWRRRRRVGAVLSTAAGMPPADESSVPVTAGEIAVWHRPAVRDFFGLLLLGAFSAGTSLLYYRALRLLPAWLAIILLFQFSWMTFLIDYVWTRRRPRAGQWAGLAAIAVGTFFAAGIRPGEGTLTAAGVGFGLAAGFTYAAMLYAGGLAALRVPPVNRAAWTTTFGAVLVLVSYAPAARQISSVLHAWLYGGLTAIFSQVAPALLFAVAVPRVGATAAAVLGSVELPVAVILAAFWLGERITVYGVVGIALICGGIVCAQWSVARAR